MPLLEIQQPQTDLLLPQQVFFFTHLELELPHQ
jgi:hypothetical protein